MSIAQKLTAVAANEQRVYDAGRQAAYDAFWDAFQQRGENSLAYGMYSGQGWTDETYNPKYPLVGYSANNAFIYSQITDTKVDIDISAAGANISNLFAYAANLRTVRKLIVSESNNLSAAFTGATALENITIEGVIGRNCDMHWCPLTVESMHSVIAALKDLSGTAASYTLTLGEENLAKLTDEDKALVTARGWKLA